MKWAALATWIVTAAGGLYMLLIWIRHGGLKKRSAPRRGIRPQVLFTHFGLAATGLILWIIHLASGSQGIGWVALGFLVPVYLLGVSMIALGLVRARHRRQAPTARKTVVVGAGPASAGDPSPTGGSNPAGPPERHFPRLVVIQHGIVATVTLGLVINSLN